MNTWLITMQYRMKFKPSGDGGHVEVVRYLWTQERGHWTLDLVEHRILVPIRQAPASGAGSP